MKNANSPLFKPKFIISAGVIVLSGVAVLVGIVMQSAAPGGAKAQDNIAQNGAPSAADPTHPHAAKKSHSETMDEKLFKLAEAEILDFFSSTNGRRIVEDYNSNDDNCNPDFAIRNMKVVSVEYGTITSDGNRGEQILDNRVPAIKAIFGTICMDRERGRDHETFYGIFKGLDEKYGTIRCDNMENITIYSGDHKTLRSTGKHLDQVCYRSDRDADVCKYDSAELKCGFVPRSLEWR